MIKSLQLNNQCILYMEGKAMKKKIILVLSFLMVAMYLTGCSVIVTPEKIDEITQIAQNVKDNPTYQLPEGYELSYADSSKNDRIIINTCGSDVTHSLKLTFDTSNNTVELIQTEETYNLDIIVIAVVFAIIGLFVGFKLCSVLKP